jgi:aminopeptidase N
MQKLLVASVLVLLMMVTFSSSISRAQNDLSIFDEIKRQHEWLEKNLHTQKDLPAKIIPDAIGANPTLDVQHYKLQIGLTPEPASFTGKVIITAQTLSPTASIAIDAFSNLTIDAVHINGQARQFQRNADNFVVSFSNATVAGQLIAVEISYHGTPTSSGALNAGMRISKRANSEYSVISTLSEPYGGPSWWPSIDDPNDKATVEIEATVPENFVVAANGVLSKIETQANQSKTYFYREDYLIAPYLVSLAATNYAKFEDEYTALDGVTKMPLVFYAYPEHLEQAQQKFAITRRALEIYAPLYGEYPFLREKYGMAEFQWTSSMEHQTMTSLSERVVTSDGTGYGTIVHELAHQWWGDLVTMSTWQDIWLNEGFATYSEVLFYERYYNLSAGELMSNSYDDKQVYGRLGGTVTAENLSNPFDDTGAIYTKGAWVLHMLRHLMGDEQFFATLKDYSQAHAFANASTIDFQKVCEARYGAPLDWFFQQWIYAQGRPIYKVSSEIIPADSGNFIIALTIKQKQTHTIPGRVGDPALVYSMPLDAVIHYADGSSETRVIQNNLRKQKYRLAVAKRPVSLVIDENNWVLKKVKGG